MKKKIMSLKSHNQAKKKERKETQKKKQFWRLGHHTHMPNLNNSGQSD
jgi:hypothetical protein